MNLISSLYLEGRNFESTFSGDEFNHSEAFLSYIEKLKKLINSSDLSERKVGELAHRISPPWNQRKFLDLLVPLERLNQKNITDSEWLHNQPDKIPAQLKIQQKSPLIIVADHIRSAFNIGAILRCADAFAVEKLILTGYSPLPSSSGVQKTALGAETHVPWEHFEHTEDAIHHLKNLNYKVLALETSSQAQNLYHSNLPPRMALILGNERFGLNTNILKLCDDVIQIPMLGIKNSLNVSTSLAIVAYEWHRQHFTKLNSDLK